MSRLVPALSSLSTVSLRVKLVASYLLVALGTILILAFAVVLAVRNYLVNAQFAVLHQQAMYRAAQLEHAYRFSGNWDNLLHGSFATDDPVILVLVDAAGRQVLCAQPDFLAQKNCDDPTLKQALATALAGQDTQGNVQISTADESFSSLYVPYFCPK